MRGGFEKPRHAADTSAVAESPRFIQAFVHAESVAGCND